MRIRSFIREFFQDSPEKRFRRELKATIRNLPWFALMWQADKLSPRELTQCARNAPGAALSCAKHLLSPKDLNWCLENEKRAALQCAPELLGTENLLAYANENPQTIRQALRDQPGHPLAGLLFPHLGSLDKTVASAVTHALATQI
jgi:hypothetical protein